MLAVLAVSIWVGGITVYASKKEEDLIPESLLEFKDKYPEASEFVDAYPEKKDQTVSIDISGEVTEGTIPLFIQWDERWGYRSYGNDFFAVNGCGPTCLSMVVCGLTGNTEYNPYEVGVFSQDSGYYVSGEGTSWELMSSGAEALGIHSEYGILSADYISGRLQEGSPVICSMYPGDFTYTGHFIVLTGIDSEGKVLVNDPNSKVNSEKHWDMEVLLPQIRTLWSYTAIK